MQEIREGIRQFGIVEHPEFGKVYAYEADGMGNYLLMDDANMPSLLSIPFLGYTDETDEIYQNTRRMILSASNPYYYEGRVLKGIGSPHSPKDYVWPIALALQGLTAQDPEELDDIFAMLNQSDNDTFSMHESVCKDDASKYTREWFSWACSMYAGFVLHYLKTRKASCFLRAVDLE